MYRIAQILAVLCVLAPHASWGQSADATLRVVVFDQLGLRLEASVTLFRDGEVVVSSTTDVHGECVFVKLSAGRYRIETHAPGFHSTISDSIYISSSANVVHNVTLQIGPLEQHVVVTAAAMDLPASRVGAPVTIIGREMLDDLAKIDVLETLKSLPGLNVVQTGQRGGAASVFIRGGEADFNKVLIDGIPVNDVGGAIDLDSLVVAGVDRVEVLRTTNSVLYGSDALSGVINVTTRRGSSLHPELTYSADVGNFGTFRHELSFGGIFDRFDYFIDLSRFDTRNNVPNNAFRNNNLSGQFGVVLGGVTDLSVTVRRTGTAYGVPGAMHFNGIADDSLQTNHLTYVGATMKTELSERLQGTLRFALSDRNYSFTNPAPTGEPFNPWGVGAHYLGDFVSITGANGFTTSGRAILDYGGVYPSVYKSVTKRRSVFGQIDHLVSRALEVSGGVRIEDEEGASGVSARTERNNVGSFIEGRTRLTERIHITSGIAFDYNEVFGYAITPRISVASYLRTPLPSSFIGFTKLTFNAGSGIKAPSLFDEQSSIFSILTSNVPNGDQLLARSGIGAIKPERSRNIDVGIQQSLWGGNIQLNISAFYNTFDDLIEYVSPSVLPQLGVPVDVATATLWGATVNASSFLARGIETSGEVMFGNSLRLAASYTYLDATVLESFASGVLWPSVNPMFPGIAIGQYAPLIGARPFRRPAHLGTMWINFKHDPIQVGLLGTFTGKSDDSTFLSDAFFGSSLLLPNHNLGANYQKIDLSISIALHQRLRWRVNIDNLLNQKYESAPGYPALPATFRTGLTIDVM